VKVLFVCSSGGHLAQLYRLRSWWDRHEREWVTFDTPDAVALLEGERVAWAHHPTTRNVPNLMRNLGLAWRLLRRDRPDVIVSDGAGVAAPFFALGKLLRIATAYIEVYDRVDTRTVTGRLCYPLADLFCVQWDEQRRLYPRAERIGVLL